MRSVFPERARILGLRAAKMPSELPDSTYMNLEITCNLENDSEMAASFVSLMY